MAGKAGLWGLAALPYTPPGRLYLAWPLSGADYGECTTGLQGSHRGRQGAAVVPGDAALQPRGLAECGCERGERPASHDDRWAGGRGQHGNTRGKVGNGGGVEGEEGRLLRVPGAHFLNTSVQRLG